MKTINSEKRTRLSSFLENFSNFQTNNWSIYEKLATHYADFNKQFSELKNIRIKEILYQYCPNILENLPSKSSYINICTFLCYAIFSLLQRLQKNILEQGRQLHNISDLISIDTSYIATFSYLLDEAINFFSSVGHELNHAKDLKETLELLDNTNDYLQNFFANIPAHLIAILKIQNQIIHVLKDAEVE